VVPGHIGQPCGRNPVEQYDRSERRREIEGLATGIEDTYHTQSKARRRQRHVADLMASREARDLVTTYFGISDPRLRKKVLEMAGLLTSREKDELKNLAGSDQLAIRGKLENGAA